MPTPTRHLSLVILVVLSIVLTSHNAEAVSNWQAYVMGGGRTFFGVVLTIAKWQPDPLTDGARAPVLSVVLYTPVGNQMGAGQLTASSVFANSTYVNWFWSGFVFPNIGTTVFNGSSTLPPYGVSYEESNNGVTYTAFGMTRMRPGGNEQYYNSGIPPNANNWTGLNPDSAINNMGYNVAVQRTNTASVLTSAALSRRTEVQGAPPNSSSVCIGRWGPAGPVLALNCSYYDSFTAKHPTTGIPLNTSAVLNPDASAIVSIYGREYGVLRTVRTNGSVIQDILLPEGIVPEALSIDARGDYFVYGDPNARGGNGYVSLFRYDNGTQQYPSTGLEMRYPYKAVNRGLGKSVYVNWFATHVCAGAPFSFSSNGAVVYWKKFATGYWMPSQIPLTSFGGFASTSRLYLGWSTAIQPTATRLFSSGPGDGIISGSLYIYNTIDDRIFPKTIPVLPDWQQVWIPLTFRTVNPTTTYVDGIASNRAHSGVVLAARGTNNANTTASLYYPLSAIFARDTNPTTPGAAYNVIDASIDIMGTGVSPPFDTNYNNSNTLVCLSSDLLRKIVVVRTANTLSSVQIRYSGRDATGDDWTTNSNSSSSINFRSPCMYSFFNDIVCSATLNYISWIDVAYNTSCYNVLTTLSWPGVGTQGLSSRTTIYQKLIPQPSTYPIPMVSQNGFAAQLALSGNEQILIVLPFPNNALYTFNWATGDVIQVTNITSMSITYVNAMTTDWVGQRLVISYSTEAGTIPHGVSATYQVAALQIDPYSAGRFHLPATMLPATVGNRTAPTYMSGGLASCKSGAKVFVGGSVFSGQIACAIPYVSPITHQVGSSWNVDTNNTVCAFNVNNTGVLISRSDRNVLSLDGSEAWFRSQTEPDSVFEYRALNTYQSECLDISNLAVTVPLFDTYSIEPPTIDQVGFTFQLFGFAWALSDDAQILVVGAVRESTLELVAFVYNRTTTTPAPNSTIVENEVTPPEYTLFDVLGRGPQVVLSIDDLLAANIVNNPPNAVIRVSSGGKHVLLSSGWIGATGFAEPVYNYWRGGPNGTGIYQLPQIITIPDFITSSYSFGESIDVGRDGEILVVGAPSTLPNHGYVFVYLLGQDANGTTNVNYTLFGSPLPVPVSGALPQWGQLVSISAYGETLAVGHRTATLDIYTWANSTEVNYNYVQRLELPADPSRNLLRSIKVAGLGLNIVAQAGNAATTLGQVYLLSRSNTSIPWSTNTWDGSLSVKYYPTDPSSSTQSGGAVAVADQVGFIASSFLREFNSTSKCFQFGTFSPIDIDYWTFSEMPITPFTPTNCGSTDAPLFAQGRLGGNTYSITADGTFAAIGLTQRINSTLVSGRILFYNTPISGLTQVASSPPYYPPIPPSPPPPSDSPLQPPSSTPVAPTPGSPPTANGPLQAQLQQLSGMVTSGSVLVAIGIILLIVVCVLLFCYRPNSDPNKRKAS